MRTPCHHSNLAVIDSHPAHYSNLSVLSPARPSQPVFALAFEQSYLLTYLLTYFTYLLTLLTYLLYLLTYLVVHRVVEPSKAFEWLIYPVHVHYPPPGRGPPLGDGPAAPAALAALAALAPPRVGGSPLAHAPSAAPIAPTGLRTPRYGVQAAQKHARKSKAKLRGGRGGGSHSGHADERVMGRGQHAVGRRRLRVAR